MIERLALFEPDFFSVKKKSSEIQKIEKIFFFENLEIKEEMARAEKERHGARGKMQREKEITNS